MLRHLFSFLSNPKINETPESLSILNASLMILKFFLFYVAFILISSLIFFPILKLINLFPEQSLPISQIPLSFKLIAFVPFYEEVIFRLPLKFSKQTLFLALATLVFMIILHKFNIIIVIIITAMVSMTPFFRIIPEVFFGKMELFWQKHFMFIFYGFALSFGILHMSNFTNLKFGHYLAFPLIVSNQIVMGLLSGYIRVTYKNGFLYGVLLHFLINLPLIFISRL